ncbi:hypothetical protein ID866_9887 [Astraeus odoratus]|nr:hypothetical protein ID866_9887 [Astraeus odoratus]
MQIECAKWPPAVIGSFNWFFYNLENHVLRQQAEQGEKILLHYANRVRTEWHDMLPADCFNIAVINNAFMDTIAQELHSKELGWGIAW